MLRGAAALAGRFSNHLARRPRPADYVLAVGLAGTAILCRVVCEAIAPGAPYLIVLLPAVVLSGAFFGTLPAIATAAVGILANALMFADAPLLVQPPLNPTQMSLIAFLPACAAVLWATHILRRFAASAAMAEARLAETFRQIPGAAAILEAPGGRLLLRSAQSDQVLGQTSRPVGEIADLGTYGGIHPDGRLFAAADYPIARALNTGELIHGERLRYRQMNGVLVDLEVHAGPVRDVAGRIVAAVGMAFDVSERADAERRLRESEEQHRSMAGRLRAAIDAGTLGLWEFDRSTQMVHLDAKLAEMLGLPGEATEMRRDEIAPMVHPDDQSRAAAVFDDALTGGGPYSDEFRMVTAAGVERWFVTRGAVLAGSARVVGVMRDVTERRRREDELRAALAAREILMREADHRIKNSLQLVVSLLRLQRTRAHDPDAREALEAAMARVTAVADAHLALQHSPDLKSLEIDVVLDNLSGRLGLLNPAVVLTCESTVGLWLDAEVAIPLGLIASELLTNALRHAFPHGVPGSVTLTAMAQNGVLEMIVTDTGIGLPDAPRRTGLGTAVTAGLAKQIGATLTTQSAPGLGTTVTLAMKLPARTETGAGYEAGPAPTAEGILAAK